METDDEYGNRSRDVHWALYMFYGTIVCTVGEYPDPYDKLKFAKLVEFALCIFETLADLILV